MKSRTILQLSKYYPPAKGGIELVAEMITKAHRSQGDKVIVLSFGDCNKTYTGEYGESVIQIQRQFFVLSTPINFWVTNKVSELLKEYHFDLLYVHLHNPLMHEVCKLFLPRLRVMGVETRAVYHSDLLNQGRLGEIYQYHFKNAESVYDRFICSSEKLWNTSPVLSKIQSSKKMIVNFCVKEEVPGRIRENFNLTAVAVGRSVPYKGFEFLVDTLNHTKFQLDILGSGPLTGHLQDIAADNIKIHGHVDEEFKNRVLDEAGVYIMSSINRTEAYGMVIVEAFQRGIPVIAADINSGVTYLVQQEKTGLIFDILDSQGLIGCLERISQDPQLYKSLSRQSREFFDQNLSFDQFKSKLVHG